MNLSMQSYLVGVFAHVLLGIALVGYGLFWAILTMKGRGTEAASQTHTSLLDLTQRTLWPPRGLPVPVRFPMWALGWLLLAAVILSGLLTLGWDALVASVQSEPFEWLSLRTKLFGVGLAGVWLLLATLRPRRVVLTLFFLTLLSIVALSSVLVR